MTDPITDMLNQIKSAQAVEKTEVSIPLSNMKYSIASILSKEGFLGEVKKIAKDNKKFFKILLKYDNGVSAISDFKRISKPGQRIYQGTSEIKKVRGGYGVSIISTSKGLMTNKQARQNNLGGEVLCQVW